MHSEQSCFNIWLVKQFQQKTRKILANTDSKSQSSSLSFSPFFSHTLSCSVSHLQHFFSLSPLIFVYPPPSCSFSISFLFLCLPLFSSWSLSIFLSVFCPFFHFWPTCFHLLFTPFLCSPSPSALFSSPPPFLSLFLHLLCSSSVWSSAGCTSLVSKMLLMNTVTIGTDFWARVLVKEQPSIMAACPNGSSVCQTSTDQAAPAPAKLGRIHMLLCPSWDGLNRSAATCSFTERTFILENCLLIHQSAKTQCYCTSY